MTRVCPYCQAHVDDEAWCEVAHMENVHPQIIVERLRAAGMHQEAEEREALLFIGDFERELDARIAGKNGTPPDRRERLAAMRPILVAKLRSDPVAWATVMTELVDAMLAADDAGIGRG